MKPRYEVAQVLEQQWQAIEQGQPRLNSWQLRCLNALRRCRTPALGGHIDGCTACGHLRISYNSCRNRHCPKCQGHKREEWMEKRAAELLPAPYFHIVFTLPSELNPLAISDSRLIYNSLFQAAWQTLDAFGKKPKWLGGQMGMIAILHTWGQNLSLHPHLHCIVPGGALTKQGVWKTPRAAKGKYLFPVKALSVKFRARYCELLRKKSKRKIPQSVFDQLFSKKWVVYAKQAFGGPHQVIEYLGRYTHKIAISNHRLLAIDQKQVQFKYKDYRHQAKAKQMGLSPEEFVRRFALHILPKGYVRIRHYGLLSSTWKRDKLPALQDTLQYEPLASEKQRLKNCCPRCKKVALIVLQEFGIRGPPENWHSEAKRKLDKYKTINH